jgi:glycosyltransferase involved in cell wall biosynthesis
VLSSTWPVAGAGGGPVFVRELVRRLTPWFDIVVLVPHAAGLPLREQDGDFQVWRYRYAPQRFEQLAYGAGIAAQLREQRWRWLLVPLFVLAQTFAIRAAIRRFGPDLIHAHWLLPQAVAASFVAGALPLACTCHGTDIFGFNGRLAVRLKRRAALACAGIAVVSRGLAAAFRTRLPDAPVPHVQPMGVDLRARFVPQPGVMREPRRLLYVGRLIEFKGVEVLLRAMPRVLARHPGLALDIAGDGHLRAELTALSEQLGLASMVHFLGPVKQQQLPALYSRATACVVPSVRTAQGHEEALGLVMVEALGCACPVVGSDLPGMQDVLTHDETALVFAAGDPDALADALLRLLDDPALGQRLAERGRAQVLAGFDWEVVARAHAVWLGSLLPPRLSPRMNSAAWRIARR